MMCVADTFAVICADCIDDKKERKMVLDSLRGDGKEVVLITEDQVNNFAGNMLALKNEAGNDLLALSQSAYNSLSDCQRNTLEKYCTLIPLAIPTIETIGGGSARCMIAENFLPIKSGL